ncbi:MAG: PIN domain-containing protein [Acidobacteria bacterium]|nr:PIN domain-containing protein [Acidobacteriota bacterium]
MVCLAARFSSRSRRLYLRIQRASQKGLTEDRGIQAADYFLTVILPSLPLAVLDNSLEDVIAAARLKAVHARSYADCFAAATAIREQAPLVTGDPEFKKLGQAVEIDWIG